MDVSILTKQAEPARTVQGAYSQHHLEAPRESSAGATPAHSGPIPYCRVLPTEPERFQRHTKTLAYGSPHVVPSSRHLPLGQVPCFAFPPYKSSITVTPLNTLSPFGRGCYRCWQDVRQDSLLCGRGPR